MEVVNFISAGMFFFAGAAILTAFKEQPLMAILGAVIQCALGTAFLLGALREGSKLRNVIETPPKALSRVDFQGARMEEPMITHSQEILDELLRALDAIQKLQMSIICLGALRWDEGGDHVSALGEVLAAVRPEWAKRAREYAARLKVGNKGG